MNPPEPWFQNTHGHEVYKWVHHFDIYHRHLQKFQKITLVEFGVWLGGSAQMWREYFGPSAQLYGVDIEPARAQWSTPWFEHAKPLIDKLNAWHS